MVLSWKCSRFGPFQFLSRQWQSIQNIYRITILVIYIIIYTNHIFSNSYQLNFDKKENNNKSTLITRAYLIWQTDQLFYMILLGENRDTRSVFKRKKYKQQRKRSTTKNVINSFYEFYFLSLILSSCLVEQTAVANRWKIWSFLWPNNGL